MHRRALSFDVTELVAVSSRAACAAMQMTREFDVSPLVATVPIFAKQTVGGGGGANRDAGGGSLAGRPITRTRHNVWGQTRRPWMTRCAGRGVGAPADHASHHWTDGGQHAPPRSLLYPANPAGWGQTGPQSCSAIPLRAGTRINNVSTTPRPPIRPFACPRQPLQDHPVDRINPTEFASQARLGYHTCSTKPAAQPRRMQPNPWPHELSRSKTSCSTQNSQRNS